MQASTDGHALSPRFLCRRVSSFPLGVHLGVELQDHVAPVRPTLCGPSDCAHLCPHCRVHCLCLQRSFSFCRPLSMMGNRCDFHLRFFLSLLSESVLRMGRGGGQGGWEPSEPRSPLRSHPCGGRGHFCGSSVCVWFLRTSRHRARAVCTRLEHTQTWLVGLPAHLLRAAVQNYTRATIVTRRHVSTR